MCMGYVDADVASYHACLANPGFCRPDEIQMRTLAFSCLYNWVRETVFDTRDIDEDVKEKLHTLPVTLGRTMTIWLATLVAFVGDVLISPSTGFENVIRPASMMLLCLFCLQYPRESGGAWAIFALFGLTPATWAQIRL